MASVRVTERTPQGSDLILMIFSHPAWNSRVQFRYEVRHNFENVFEFGPLRQREEHPLFRRFHLLILLAPPPLTNVHPRKFLVHRDVNIPSEMSRQTNVSAPSQLIDGFVYVSNPSSQFEPVAKLHRDALLGGIFGLSLHLVMPEVNVLLVLPYTASPRGVRKTSDALLVKAIVLSCSARASVCPSNEGAVYILRII